MAAWSECEEWAASTLSQKVAWVMSETGFMLMGWAGWDREPVPSGRLVAPELAAAAKRTPRGKEESVEAERGAVSEIGRFGQPSTPTLTTPETMRARQTAYWPPRRKPLVPSMGSRAQIRPWGPPALLPASMASSICDSVSMGPPSSSSEVGSLKWVVWTRDQI